VTGLRIATGALAAACALLAGCSSSPDFTMSDGAGATVRADVLALTTAVAHNQWTTADTALAQLRGDVAAAVAAGQMSELKARVIRADLALIEADLAKHRLSATPLPPITSSSSSKPKPPPAPKPPKEDHGHGHGHGHGHEGED
jgi:hypothetical protein